MLLFREDNFKDKIKHLSNLKPAYNKCSVKIRMIGSHSSSNIYAKLEAY